MTYTTQQLQAMSDFEVNQLLFEKYMPKGCFCYEADKRDGLSSVFWDTANDEFEVNYCKNPNDIMPLAFERGIRLSPYMDIWRADFIATEQNYFDKSPLRAIACLLLLMEN